MMKTIPISPNVPTRALAANPNRKVVSIQNNGTEPVFYADSAGVQTSGFNQGWTIPPQGTIEDEYNKGEVWLIASNYTTVTIQEV
jgi:hypothetical protein